MWSSPYRERSAHSPVGTEERRGTPLRETEVSNVKRIVEAGVAASANYRVSATWVGRKQLEGSIRRWSSLRRG